MPLGLLDLSGQPETVQTPFFGLNLMIYGNEEVYRRMSDFILFLGQ